MVEVVVPQLETLGVRVVVSVVLLVKVGVMVMLGLRLRLGDGVWVLDPLYELE